MLMVIRRIAVLVLVGGLLYGCNMYSNQGATVKGTGWTGGNMAGISISGYAFSPSSFSFPAANNVTVTWTNNDPVTHTVTSNTGNFTSSGNIGPGATYVLTFPSPGTYAYHCSIHTFMTGTITVN